MPLCIIEGAQLRGIVAFALITFAVPILQAADPVPQTSFDESPGSYIKLLSLRGNDGQENVSSAILTYENISSFPITAVIIRDRGRTNPHSTNDIRLGDLETQVLTDGRLLMPGEKSTMVVNNSSELSTLEVAAVVMPDGMAVGDAVDSVTHQNALDPILANIETRRRETQAPTVISAVAPETCSLGIVYDEDNFAPSDGSGPITPPMICIQPGEFDPPPIAYPTNPDAPPPPPICTISARFRNINTSGGSLAGHGYVTFFSSYTHQTRIIEGYTDDSGLLKAWDSAIGLAADNPSKDTSYGGIGGTNVCPYESTIFGPAVNKINNAAITYHYFGPNSNSVWRYLISRIPGFKTTPGFPPVGAVGFSAKLPGVE